MRLFLIFSTFIFVSCSTPNIRRDMASVTRSSKLSCLENLANFEQVKRPHQRSLSSVEIEVLLEDKRFRDVYDSFNHPVEKEQAAEIVHYIQKEFAQESVEKQKSHFWDLFSCKI